MRKEIGDVGGRQAETGTSEQKVRCGRQLSAYSTMMGAVTHTASVGFSENALRLGEDDGLPVEGVSIRRVEFVDEATRHERGVQRCALISVMGTFEATDLRYRVPQPECL